MNIRAGKTIPKEPGNTEAWKGHNCSLGRDKPSGPKPVWEPRGRSWPWLIHDRKQVAEASDCATGGKKGQKGKLFSRGTLGSPRRRLHGQVSAIPVPVLSFSVYNSIKAETEKIRHIQQRKTKLPAPSSSYHWEHFRTHCTAGKPCSLLTQMHLYSMRVSWLISCFHTSGRSNISAPTFPWAYSIPPEPRDPRSADSWTTFPLVNTERCPIQTTWLWD